MNTASFRMLQHFAYDYLPNHLKVISSPIAELAVMMAETLDSEDSTAGAEVTTGLRKLLEAKDCFVRAGVRLNAYKKE